MNNIVKLDHMKIHLLIKIKIIQYFQAGLITVNMVTNGLEKMILGLASKILHLKILSYLCWQWLCFSLLSKGFLKGRPVELKIMHIELITIVIGFTACKQYLLSLRIYWFCITSICI